MKRAFLFSLLVSVLIACLAIAPRPADTGVPAAVATQTSAVPASPTGTVEPSSTPTVSDTPPPTLPPFIASIPGIAATMTAGFSTPGMVATLSARQTMVAATQVVQMRGLAVSMLKMCTKPAEAPVANWDNIPIMPQATGSQELRTLIGSFYCYQAPVTVTELETFYTGQMPPQGWILQFDKDGLMNFIKLGQQGPGGMLWILSGPGQDNALKVVIIPFAMPG